MFTHNTDISDHQLKRNFQTNVYRRRQLNAAWRKM